MNNNTYRVTDGGDLLSTLLVELNVELLLEGHHDLDGVEGVGTEVSELGVSGDLVGVHAELLGDDATDVIEDGGGVLQKISRRNENMS